MVRQMEWFKRDMIMALASEVHGTNKKEDTYLLLLLVCDLFTIHLFIRYIVTYMASYVTSYSVSLS